MKKALTAVFAVICGCFFLACISQKEEIIEQNSSEEEQIPIAKIDANITLPSGCEDGGSNCFDELNPPLPVSPKQGTK